MSSLLFDQLLWEPLPDRLATEGRQRRRLQRLRDLTATLTASVPPISAQEQVIRRVRRGAIQVLVREAYQATVAEQDREHRPPAPFAQAWHDHLAGFLDQPSVELHGWGTLTIADLDVNLTWSLYKLASQARHDAIENAEPSPSLRVQRGQAVPTFGFSIVADGTSLGDVTYGICEPCRTGLLYNIGFPTDWQFCGLGRLALNQLEARHPEMAWYTTGQFQHARGFYDRYRQGSGSPWTPRQHPCPHFD
jgi:hypothetical protein